MLLKVRADKNKTWGILENYSTYYYKGKLKIEAWVVANLDGVISQPYNIRQNLFIPTKDIDGEVGLDKYIKAKKPFYSLLKDGVVVKLISKVDVLTGDFLEEESSFKIYLTKGNILEGDKLSFSEAIGINPEISNRMKNALKLLADSGGDRLLFLQSRYKKD